MVRTYLVHCVVLDVAPARSGQPQSALVAPPVDTGAEGRARMVRCCCCGGCGWTGRTEPAGTMRKHV